MLQVHRAAGFTLGLALSACAPGGAAPAGLVLPPTAPPSAAAGPAAAPPAPVTAPANLQLRAVANLPAVAVPAWRRALGLGGDGLPRGAELAPLHVRWGDEIQDPGRVQFAEPRWQGSELAVFPLALADRRDDGRWLQVMTGDERVLLAGRGDGQGGTVTLTLASTAAWMLQAALTQRGLPDGPEPAPIVLGALADRLLAAWLTGTGPAARSVSVTQALAILTGAIAEGLSPDMQIARLNQSPGGGMGGGAAAPPPPAPLTVLPRVTGAAR